MFLEFDHVHVKIYCLLEQMQSRIISAHHLALKHHYIHIFLSETYDEKNVKTCKIHDLSCESKN